MRTLPERPARALSFSVAAAGARPGGDWREWARLGLPLAAVVLALASFSAAGWIIFSRFRAIAPSALQTPAAGALIAAALAQVWLAARLWRLRNRALRQWLSPLAWTGALLVGLVACYGFSLMLGPSHAASAVFAAGAMSWTTLLLLPLAASAENIERLRRLVARPGARRGYQVLCAASLLLLFGESALRAGAWMLGPESFEPAKPMFVDRMQSAAEAACNDTEQALTSPAEALASGASRSLVILGDRLPVAKQAAADGGPLSAISADRLVFHVRIPEGGLRDYVRQGMPRVAKLRPDLLLVFFSVGDDLVAEQAERDLFDWRGLSTPRAIERWTGWPDRRGADPLCRFAAAAGQPPIAQPLGRPSRLGQATERRWEDYVAACAPHLATCRKPVDATMRTRWKSTFACFRELETACRREDIQLGIIVAPSPLQTNRALLEAVCRRQGVAARDVDLELPQRRLAAYAAERKLPTLDLLPALRQSVEPAFAHQDWQWTDAGQSIVSRTLDGWVGGAFPTAPDRSRSRVAAAWSQGEPSRLVSQ